MFNKQEQQAYLVLIDQNIETLQKRIDAIVKLSAEMEAKGLDIKAQTELLATMRSVMAGIKTIRLEAVEALKAEDARTHTRLNS